MPLFERYIGIEYSGAKTPESSLFGLRIYVADSTNPPHAVEPPPSTRTHWTRRGVAEWLCEELAKDIPTIVGICPSSQSCPAVKSTTSQGSRQSRSAITWLPCLTCFGSGSEPCFAGFGRAAV